MTVARLETVQTIAVLGMCFFHFGDGEVASHLWSCAIRIAQRLGLGTMHSDPSVELSLESQRRLWWTLIIVEWSSLYHQQSGQRMIANVLQAGNHRQSSTSRRLGFRRATTNPGSERGEQCRNTRGSLPQVHGHNGKSSSAFPPCSTSK